MIEEAKNPYQSLLSGLRNSAILRLSRIWLVILLAALLLGGCSSGSNKIKLHIQNPGEFEARFNHDGSGIELWTDFDVEFTEPLSMVYQISFYQGNDLVDQVSCDPFAADEKRMHRYVENNGLVKVSYLGQMQCNVDLPEGETVVSVHFEAVANNLKIFRADLIIK